MKTNSSAMAVTLGTERFIAHCAAISAAGKGHDRVLVADDFVGVADGASPLAVGWPDPGPFAQEALQRLRQAARAQKPVQKLWRSAINQVGQLPSSYLLSAAVMICRSVAPRVLEISALGDCCGLVSTRQGEVRLIHEPTIAERDRAALAAPKAADRSALLISQRMEMNRAGSYWIFAGAPDAGDHVHSASFSVDDVEALLLMTDGVLWLMAQLTGRSFDELLSNPEALHAEATTRLCDRSDDELAVLAKNTPDDCGWVQLRRV